MIGTAGMLAGFAGALGLAVAPGSTATINSVSLSKEGFRVFYEPHSGRTVIVDERNGRAIKVADTLGSLGVNEALMQLRSLRLTGIDTLLNKHPVKPPSRALLTATKIIAGDRKLVALSEAFS